MFTTRHDQNLGESEKKTIDLFFGALFRLGVWTGDWETWYGTRPLAPWAREPRPAVPAQRGTTTEHPHR